MSNQQHTRSHHTHRGLGKKDTDALASLDIAFDRISGNGFQNNHEKDQKELKANVEKALRELNSQIYQFQVISIDRNPDFDFILLITEPLQQRRLSLKIKVDNDSKKETVMFDPAVADSTIIRIDGNKNLSEIQNMILRAIEPEERLKQ